jgi:hypothetical protein
MQFAPAFFCTSRRFVKIDGGAMDRHDRDYSESITSSPAPVAQPPDMQLSDELVQPRLQRHGNSPAGMFFGALAGLLLGAVAAGACCWVVGQDEFFWHGTLAGAVIGPLGGAAIGVRERKTRGDLIRPDIAAIIGVAYGLLPALLIVLGGVGLVRGKLSGLLLIGAGFAGPMSGLLIGGILDRAYEARRRKSWRAALGFGLVGSAAAIGILLLIARASSGPDPEELVAPTRSAILREWRKDPELQGVKIRNLTLARDSGNRYSGFFDAIIDGQALRHTVTVTVHDADIEVRWAPLDE